VARHSEVSAQALEAADPLPRPFVLKPVNEGSSVGVSILREGDNRRADIARGWTHGSRIMAEEFIPGRELTVAVMGERALTVTEIETSLAFYDYEAKYAEGGSHHRLPAAVHPAIAQQAMEVALAAHQELLSDALRRAKAAEKAQSRAQDQQRAEARRIVQELEALAASQWLRRGAKMGFTRADVLLRKLIERVRKLDESTADGSQG
jgi:predicted ATP-grasp superfamily ATP-dependent carboligase